MIKKTEVQEATEGHCADLVTVLSLGMRVVEFMDRYKFESCKPQDVGISEQWIRRFLQIIKEKKICMHSMLMMHKGKVIFEEYASPYTKDSLQRMYSVSKSFTALAVGILADDHIISLDDKIVDYFPDMVDESCHPYIKETTIRQLLTMSGPFGTLKGFNRDNSQWTKSYFQKKPDYPSGTLFYYDTSGTRVLTAMVERLVHKNLMDFLKDRVFRELGFSENVWCIKTPDGFSHGGSGVMASLRDIALFGLLLMGNGAVNGKRYVSEAFVKAAVTPQVFNNYESMGLRTHKGYGYQIWCMEQGFALKGMGSQQVICVPEKDFLFCCTADTQGNRIYYEGLYDYLFFEIIDKIAPVKAEYTDFSIGFEPIDGRKSSKIQERINGVTYQMDENTMGISAVRLSLGEDVSFLSLQTPRGEKVLKFGMGTYLESTFPETHYSGDVFTEPANREYRCTGCGAWVSEHQFAIRTYIIDDYLGNLTVTLGFKGDQLGLRMCKNAENFLNEYEGCAGGTAVV